MDINNIASIVVIIVIIVWILYNSSKKTKERFDQFASASSIPAGLLEKSSINSIQPNPALYEKSGKKTQYGNFASSVNPNLSNSLEIDYTNIEYLKSRVINVSKPINIDLTYIDVKKFPIKLLFYNSTSKDLSLNLIFNSSNGQVVSPLICVSNYMTGDVNRLKLSLNSLNIINYSIVTRLNYMSRGRGMFTSSGNKIVWSGIASDIDDIASVPVDVVLPFKTTSGDILNITAVPAPVPAPAPST